MEYARDMVATGRVGVNQACRLLGLSKKSYYRSISPDESLEARYGSLKTKLEKIISDNPSYGYRRLKQALFDKYGLRVNHKLLLKLLRIWQLLLKRRIRRPTRGWVQVVLDFLEIRANLLWQLKRRNLISRCFQVVVSDITEIHFQGAKAYLCVHLDLVGKMIYGFQLGLSPDRKLVLQSFRKSLAKIRQLLKHVPAGIVFHQDRGSVYTSDEYVGALIDAKSKVSYSRSGEPGDNAVNESFFSRFKDEWRDVFSEARSFSELEAYVKKAIDYYNNSRYHSSIGMTSPAAFTLQQVVELTNSHRKAVS